MRRIRLHLLSVISLLFMTAIIAEAAPRTAGEAKRLAEQFFTAQALSVQGNIHYANSWVLTLESAPRVDGTLLRNSSNDDACYYFIYNRGDHDGFVIVSGDDRLTPYIGYSTTGHFSSEDMPSNLAAFMEHCRLVIANLLSEGSDYSGSDLHPEPHQNGLRSSVAPLLGGILWNQSYPWNNQTPTYQGEHMPVGCVATAYTQIMRYYRWPDQGEGKYSYYDKQSQNYLSVEFNVNYDWANMPESLPTPQAATSAQEKALATLSFHAGVAVDMAYAPDGSGTYSPYVLRALKEHFRYDKGVAMKRRIDFTQSTWEAMIMAELDAGRPVYYSGYGQGGGHAFVCDGYNSEGLFHFNWGWAGMSNGYFNLNFLVPSAMGIGGGAGGGFSMGQEIIVGFKPDRNGSSKEYNDPLLCTNKSDIRLLGGSDISISAEASAFLTDSYKYKGKITVGITKVGSSDTTWVEDIAMDVEFIDLFDEMPFSVSKHAYGPMDEGTYEVFLGHLATRPNGHRYWRANSQYQWGMVGSQFYTIKKENGKYTVTHEKMKSRFNLQAVDSSFDYKIVRYSESYISIDLKNTGSKEFHGFLYLAGVDGNGYMNGIANMLPAIDAGKTQTIRFNVPRFPFSDNSYSLVLYYVDELNQMQVIRLPKYTISATDDYANAVIMESVDEVLVYGKKENELSPIRFKKIGPWQDDDQSLYLRWILVKVNDQRQGYDSGWEQIGFTGGEAELSLSPEYFYPRKGEMLLFKAYLYDPSAEKVVDMMERKELLVSVVADLPNENIVAQQVEVKLFPNPAAVVANLQGVMPHSEVSLYDMEGRLVQTLWAGADGALGISLAALPEGQYLVSCKDIAGHSVAKQLSVAR